MPPFIALFIARAAVSGSGLFTAILNFFSTPLGRVLALLLAGGGCYLAGHVIGARDAKIDCAAKIERMVEESKSAAEARDTEIQTEAKNLADASTQQLTELNKTLETKVKAYESDILKTNSCKLGPNDIKRLRGIQ